MAQIDIQVSDYQNAPEGSLLVKKGGKWIPVTYKELNHENEKKLAEFDDLKNLFNAFSKNSKHFVKYAKSHFMVVYNYLLIKVLAGAIDVDEEVLALDKAVLSDEVSVEEAIKKHPFLEEVFEKIYSKASDMIEFPEV